MAENSENVTPEVEALRAVLLDLGVHVRDTDRWSGVELGSVKRFVTAEQRKYLDFLPLCDFGGRP